MPDHGYHLTFSFENTGEVIALGSVLPTVCCLVVGLRFFARRAQKVGVKVDDWLAFCALFPMIGMGACLIAGAALKVIGYPTPSPPPGLTAKQLEFWEPPQQTTNEIIQYPFQIMLIIAYFFIKLSIVFFYRGIFVARKGSATDIFLKVCAVVVALWSIAFELLIIFPCGARFWVNWSSAGYFNLYCPVAFTSEYGLIISDLIMDLVLFAIPIPLVWRLQMTTKRKLATIGIFLLAASAVGASIARLVVYVEDIRITEVGGDTDTDQVLTLEYFWSYLECGLALIAACLPPSYYLFTRRQDYMNFFSRTRRSASNTNEDRPAKPKGMNGSESTSMASRPMVERTVTIDVEYGSWTERNGSTLQVPRPERAHSGYSRKSSIGYEVTAS